MSQRYQRWGEMKKKKTLLVSVWKQNCKFFMLRLKVTSYRKAFIARSKERERKTDQTEETNRAKCLGRRCETPGGTNKKRSEASLLR